MVFRNGHGSISGHTGSEGQVPRKSSESSGGGNNDFAFALYEQVRQQTGNVFFSPLSIRMSLGMALAGARGGTAVELRAVLRIPPSDEESHGVPSGITQQLRAVGGDSQMVVANSLWGQEGAPPRAEFLDLIARQYDGSMHEADFFRDAEAARRRINGWIEAATGRRIQELIPSGGLGPDTRLILVNAVFFKGAWALEFRKRATRNETFHLVDGRTVAVPLMRHQVVRPYFHDDGYRAVDLPYQGGALSMLVLLPDRKDGLRDLENTFSTQMLKDCLIRMRSCEVMLFIPRFKVTWGSVDMREQLRALGVTQAFDRFRANFSGINDHEAPHEESLSLSAIHHKAVVDVNETGTEASAVAGSSMIELSLPPLNPPPVPVFRADHPFVFAIRDRKSGDIVFLGRVEDPTRES